MNNAKARNMNEVAATARTFLQAATDLYVEMLVRGRQVVAASLLQAVVLTMAHLRALGDLPEGPERLQHLRKAARIVHGISMLIIYLAGSDSQIPMPLALEAVDAASDLSGAFRSAGAGLRLEQGRIAPAQAAIRGGRDGLPGTRDAVSVSHTRRSALP